MIAGVIAIVVGIVALVMAAVALVKASDAASDLKAYKRSINETADELRQAIASVSKRVPAERAPAPGAPAALPPDTEPTVPPGGFQAPKTQIRRKKPIPPAVRPPPRQAPPAPPPPAAAPAKELFINFDCPNCAQNIDAPEVMLGMEAPCPTCGQNVKVPDKPPGPPRMPQPPAAESAPGGPGGEGIVGAEDLGEDAIKGATVRIDVNQFFKELGDDRPKRQIIIKRRQG